MQIKLANIERKNWRYNVFNHSLESIDTLKRSRSRSLNCVIVSFLRVFLQNDLTFSTTHQYELSHCAFGKSTCYMDIRSFVSIFLLRKISENETIYIPYYKIIQIVRALWLAIKLFYMSVCKHVFRSSFLSYFIKEMWLDKLETTPLRVVVSYAHLVFSQPLACLHQAM